MTVTRRSVLMGLGAATPGLVLHSSALQLAADSPVHQSAARERKLKVMVTGGHPGDPEAGCAGTIARYADLGHDVALLYLNRGQGYCRGHAGDECGEIRTVEAGNSCRILRARPLFLGQFDGRAIVDAGHYDEVAKVLDAESPDILFAQWPVDRHRDHRALSSLVLDAWLQTGRKAAFYYYEVAEDTLMFSPTEFVNISAVVNRKRSACFAHRSQGPERWYALQEQLTQVRGASSGYVQSEAFMRQWQHSDSLLP